MVTNNAASLEARDLSLAYEELLVVENLSLSIPEGQITMIVGANACGKSTLLRGMARLLKPKGGAVFLDGKSIQDLPTKDVAKRMGILPQGPISPDGIVVSDLVARGRYPHQGWIRRWTSDDERAVLEALELTDTADLASRSVDELSGGQRQRVWLAMALAQQTPLLLLDEPTTYLDLTHQLDLLDLVAHLNQSEGRTAVIVLHDLNHACRYAHHIVAMKAGAMVAQGPPETTITADLVDEVFGLSCKVIPDPETGTPLIVPARRGSRTIPQEIGGGRPAS